MRREHGGVFVLCMRGALDGVCMLVIQANRIRACVSVCLPCYILTPISTGVCIYVKTTDLIVITLVRYESLEI